MARIIYPINGKTYTAEDVEILNSPRTSGIYSVLDFDCSLSGNVLTIGKGLAWIKNGDFTGKCVAFTEPETLTLDSADSTKNRFDVVAIRYDASKTEPELVIIKGEPANIPFPPERKKETYLYELFLYAILRKAGEGSASFENLSDLRESETFCGIMRDSVTSSVAPLYETLYDDETGMSLVDSQPIFVETDKYVSYIATVKNSDVVAEIPLYVFDDISFAKKLNGKRVISTSGGKETTFLITFECFSESISISDIFWSSDTGSGQAILTKLVGIAKQPEGYVKVDDIYNPESHNAQSGEAVKQAIEEALEGFEGGDVEIPENVETTDNKVTVIDENSTDTQYPSAKAVYNCMDKHYVVDRTYNPESHNAQSGKAVAEAVSKALSGGFVVLSSPNGTKWSISVTNEGVVIATKITDFPTALESYTIFVPENVSDEWKVTGNYGELSMSTAEFLELFYDDFVTEQPVGVNVTKKPIGKDESGQYDMWEYDFCPANYSRTILLSSGMHAYELSASFGLANFIGNLYTDTENEAFSYIRNNVRVKVVPIVNPWGFNQYPKKYGNINGVNPNRNFDIDGQWASYPSYTPTENEWNVKGSAPFSEAEVHNLARWAEENYNAEFWIDCHTGESYSDKDLWLYYSSDSPILDRINAGISSIETWFKDTYGVNCVTTREIDNPDMIRMHWAEKIAGIQGICLEQAPRRTTFGTSAMNEGADISNFSTNISTFVQEFLLEKYRNNNVISITSVSANDIVISGDTPSVTVETAITPSNTTQNKFKWVSSDESVVAVYGCTNKAVIVRKGEGTATITLTNYENNSVSTSFTVTVEKDETLTEICAGIRAIDIATGLIMESTNRIVTDLIPVTAGSYTITCDSNYSIKAWVYDVNGIATGNMIGANFNSNSISGTVLDGYIRVLYKRSDNSDITEDTMQKVTGTINGAKYQLVPTTEEIQKTFNIGAGIRAVDVNNNVLMTSTNRVTTDAILIALGNTYNINYKISVPTGYTAKGFVCDAGGNLTGDCVTSNFEQESTIRYSSLGGNMYARFVIKKDDGSDFTEEEMLVIKLTTSTGYTYQLVQTEEQ